MNRLCSSGDIEKEVKGHQEVFYFIPRKSRKKVERELNRELARNAFDKIWERLTPEQQKTTVKRLTETQQLTGLLIQKTSSNMLGLIGEWIDEWIAELENPLESIERKYSFAEREQNLKELVKLRELCEMKVIEAPTTTQALKEKLAARVDLAQDFMKKVVEPNYSGKWDVAIMDLMRKAVREQEEREKEGVEP